MELLPVRQAQHLQSATSLDQVIEHVRNASAHHRDFEGVNLRSTRLRLDGTWMFGGEVGRLSRHAFQQLCSRLELPGGGTVPASYLSRCPGQLAAEHLNHWLARSGRPDQQVLVRAENGKPGKLRVRAILTDRYARADHLPLIEALTTLTDPLGLRVQSWSLDDEQFLVRLTVGEDHPASLDDPLRVGVQISNSEVGLGRISIRAFITRLICTNGLVVEVAGLDGIHRRHIGRAGEDLEQVTRLALPRVLLEAEDAATRLLNLRKVPVRSPIDDFVQATGREAGIAETMLPQVRQNLEGGTVYDVINAFTNVAHRFPVAERLRIEGAMSRFLDRGRGWN